ncbi:hypothetical protein GTI73_15200, partial [Enterococcus faecalis]|uniref:hypothetical protein n=1 Tax=Enterococcus faecalis TaxID=1351 RepID=UPI00135375D2
AAMKTALKKREWRGGEETIERVSRMFEQQYLQQTESNNIMMQGKGGGKRKEKGKRGRRKGRRGEGKKGEGKRGEERGGGEKRRRELSQKNRRFTQRRETP